MRSLVQVQNSPWHGGIAQLVERCLCKADVSGSSPLTSSQAFNLKGQLELWLFLHIKQNQSIKGIWWRPRDLEPMKGVTTDDMPRGVGRMH